MGRPKNAKKLFYKGMNLTEYFPQTCYLLRAAFLYQLYSYNLLLDLEKKVPTEKTVTEVYYRYRSMVLINHIFSGQTLNEKIVNDLNTWISGSVVFEKDANRFLYSAYVAQLRSTCFSNFQAKFLLLDATNSKLSVNLVLLKGKDSFETNLSAYEEQMHQIISVLKDLLSSYCSARKVTFSDMSLIAENPGYATMPNNNKVNIDFKFADTIQEIEDLGYFVKDDFRKFPTEKFAPSKIVFYVKDEIKGLTWDAQKKLFYKRINQHSDSSSSASNNENENTYRQEEDVESDSISQHPKQIIIKPSLFLQEDRSTETNSDQDDNLNAQRLEHEQDEIFDVSSSSDSHEGMMTIDSDVVALQQQHNFTSSTSSNEIIVFEGTEYKILKPSLTTDDVNTQFAELLAVNVDTVVTSKEYRRQLMKEFIQYNFTIVQKQSIRIRQRELAVYPKLLLTLYNDMRKRKTEELNKQNLTVNKRRSEIEKYSSKIKRELFECAEEQIRTFFQLVLEKEPSISDIITSSNYKEARDPQSKYKLLRDGIGEVLGLEFRCYKELAHRMHNAQLYSNKKQGNDAAVRQLITYFEDTVPSELKIGWTEDGDEDDEEDEEDEEDEAPSVNLNMGEISYKGLSSTKNLFNRRGKKRKAAPNRVDPPTKRINFSSPPSSAYFSNESDTNSPPPPPPPPLPLPPTTPTTSSTAPLLQTPKSLETYKKVFSLIEDVFEDDSNFNFKLIKDQATLRTILSWFRTSSPTSADFRKLLAENRIWSYRMQAVSIVSSYYYSDYPEIGFLRASLEVKQKLMNEEVAIKKDAEIIELASLDSKELPKSEDSNSYCGKIADLHSKYIYPTSNKNKTTHFNEEDFSFAFLWRLVDFDINLVVEDDGADEVKKTLIDGVVRSKPFCFTELMRPAKYNLRLSEDGWDVLLVDDRVTEFMDKTKFIINRLFKLSSFLSENNMNNSADIELIAGKFFSYVKDKNIVLSKADFNPSSGSTSASSSSSATNDTVNKATIEEIKTELLELLQDKKKEISDYFARKFRNVNFNF